MQDKMMKQAVMIGLRNVQVEEVPVPIPAPGEILVKVHRLGICGSDSYVFDGKHLVSDYPFVQGHEMSGEVADSNGSAKYKNGEKVFVVPQTFCGECDDCKAGNTNYCKENRIAGVWTPGMAREYVAYPERMLFKIPDDMSYDVAAAIEPLGVAVHASAICGDIADKNVLVLGAGVIGNFTAQVAKIRNAKKVVLAGRKEWRMEFARQAGIENLINTDKQDLGEAVLEHFGGKPEVVIDCIGSGDSVNTAISLCRKSGAVVVTGIYDSLVLTDLFSIQNDEIHVIGTMMYTAEEIKWCIELAHTGKVIVEPLITTHFTLETYNEAYEHMESKATPYMKVMIDIA